MRRARAKRPAKPRKRRHSSAAAAAQSLRRRRRHPPQRLRTRRSLRGGAVHTSLRPHKIRRRRRRHRRHRFGLAESTPAATMTETPLQALRRGGLAPAAWSPPPQLSGRLTDKRCSVEGASSRQRRTHRPAAAAATVLRRARRGCGPNSALRRVPFLHRRCRLLRRTPRLWLHVGRRARSAEALRATVTRRCGCLPRGGACWSKLPGG